MKKIAIFLLIIGNSCGTKTIRGNYCQSLNDAGGTCINFEKHNTFQWKTRTDFGPSTIGKGHFKIKNEKLYLKFKKDSVGQESSFEIIKEEETNKENIYLYIKVVDEQKMSSSNTKITTSAFPKKAYYTNSDGYVKLDNIPKSKALIEIEVEPLSVIESFGFKLAPQKNKNLLVNLSSAKPQIISDTLYVYNIKEKTQTKLDLRDPHGEHNIEFFLTNE